LSKKTVKLTCQWVKIFKCSRSRPNCWGQGQGWGKKIVSVRQPN